MTIHAEHRSRNPFRSITRGIDRLTMDQTCRLREFREQIAEEDAKMQTFNSATRAILIHLMVSESKKQQR